MLIKVATAQLARSSIARWHILPNLIFISKVTEVFLEPVALPIIQCVVIDLFLAKFPLIHPETQVLYDVS